MSAPVPVSPPDYTIAVIVAVVVLVIAAITGSTIALVFAPTAAPLIALISGVLTVAVPLLFGLVKMQELHRAVNGAHEILVQTAEQLAASRAFVEGSKRDPKSPEDMAAGRVAVKVMTDATAEKRVEVLAAAGVEGAAPAKPTP